MTKSYPGWSTCLKRIMSHYFYGKCSEVSAKSHWAETNAPRSSGNLLFFLTTSHTSLTTAECKRHFLHAAQFGKGAQGNYAARRYAVKRNTKR